MSVVVVISQHLLNVFVQLANKRGFKKKKKNGLQCVAWQRLPAVGVSLLPGSRPLRLAVNI
jgi:hypothetical protein